MKRKRYKQPSPFSENLRHLMQAKGMRLKEAARLSGVSISTIHDWREGRAPTDFFAVKKLSGALGVSLSYLLTGIEEKDQTNASSSSAPPQPNSFLFEGYARIVIKRINSRNIKEITILSIPD